MLYAFVVSFALGITFEKIFGLGWASGFFVLILSSVLFLVIRRDDDRLAKIILTVGIALCLGILRMNFVDISPDANLSKLVGQDVSFEATVSEDPDVRDTSARYTVTVNRNSLSGYSQKCTDISLLRNSSCSPQSGSQGISGNTHSKNPGSLILLVADRFPEFHYGDKIKVSGKLDVPKNFTTDSGTEFDYVSYLSKDRIDFLIYHPQIEKIGSGGNPIVSFLYSLRNYFTEKIGNVVPEPNSSFLAGLIFGAKQSLGQNLLDDFQKVGLIHIVVLSGENLTIVAAAILSFVSFFGRRKYGLLAAALGIIIFAAMVGFTTTVLRAGIMALIAILAKYLGRPNDALRALFIAGFAMVAWNPLTLFYDPSFQLSFMAALGLIIWSPLIDLLIVRKLNFIPQKFGLREIISATFAVQIFILPLLIRMSGNFSLISFVANLIVLPIVPAVMFFGFMTGLIGMLPAQLGFFLSWPFGFVSYLVSELVIKLTELFASIPFASITIGALPLSAIFVWYLVYGILFWKLKKLISPQPLI